MRPSFRPLSKELPTGLFALLCLLQGIFSSADYTPKENSGEPSSRKTLKPGSRWHTLAHAHTSQVRCTVGKGYMRTQSSQGELARPSDEGPPQSQCRQTASRPCRVSAAGHLPVSRSLGKQSLSHPTRGILKDEQKF